MAKSARMSFKGYRIQEALVRNKDVAKNVLMIVIGYSTYLGATGFQWKAFFIALGAAAATLAGKLVTDAFDFWMSEVEV